MTPYFLVAAATLCWTSAAAAPLLSAEVGSFIERRDVLAKLDGFDLEIEPSVKAAALRFCRVPIDA